MLLVYVAAADVDVEDVDVHGTLLRLIADLSISPFEDFPMPVH